MRLDVDGKTVAECLHQAGTYDSIRDAILTCTQKPTRVSLIYRMEPTIKNWKTEKNMDMLRSIGKESGESV